MADMRLMKDLMETIRQKDNGPQPYDTQAEVTRVDGGTAWVRIPGSDGETPVQMSINARAGDTVRVRVSGGHAWTVGNDTAPPTDDRTANAAQATATEAQETANTALADAQRAAEAADAAEASATAAQASAEQAEESAETAHTAATSALTGLATVEDVVGTLNWISEHGTYAATSDTEVQPGKLYFTRTGSGTEADPYVYTAVDNPTGNPSALGYYELTGVDEAVANYVATHLALTDEGLYVIADNNHWKVLIKSDGVYILNASGQQVAQFKSYAQLGLSSGAHSVIDANGQRFYGSNGTTILANIGYGPGVDEHGQTATAPYYTFGERDSTANIGNYSAASGNEVEASGYASFAEGMFTIASGRASHAEGDTTVASNTVTHAEGAETAASGMYSHSEGISTAASGYASHAEGGGTEAAGTNSHAQNLGTIANGNQQTALGKYNTADTTSAVIIGNGSDETTRSNALTVDWNGNVEASGSITDGSGNSIPWICCGAASGVSVNANSSNTFDITFPSTAPTSTPRVFAILRATSTAQNRSLIVPVVSAQSATGATVRVFNNGSSNLTDMVFNWIAMA